MQSFVVHVYMLFGFQALVFATWWLQRQSPFSAFDGCCTDSKKNAAAARPLEQKHLSNSLVDNLMGCTSSIWTKCVTVFQHVWTHYILIKYPIIYLNGCWFPHFQRPTGMFAVDLVKKLVSPLPRQVESPLNLLSIGLTGDEQQPGKYRLIRDQMTCQCKFQSFSHILPHCARATTVPLQTVMALCVVTLWVIVSFIYWSKPVAVLVYTFFSDTNCQRRSIIRSAPGHSLLFAIGGYSCPSSVSHMHPKRGAATCQVIPKTNLQGAISDLEAATYQMFTKHHDEPVCMARMWISTCRDVSSSAHTHTPFDV